MKTPLRKLQRIAMEGPPESPETKKKIAKVVEEEEDEEEAVVPQMMG